ncbi:hypothetical protein Droror1_Dr00017455 [Drosera rotundifolia]
MAFSKYIDHPSQELEDNFDLVVIDHRISCPDQRITIAASVFKHNRQHRSASTNLSFFPLLVCRSSEECCTVVRSFGVNCCNAMRIASQLASSYWMPFVPCVVS